MRMVGQKCQLIPSKDIADQKTLESDSTRNTTGHTQTKLVVLHATFP